MAFWRRGRKKSTSSEAKEEDDDLAKLQRQFGIKPVSDVDIQAEFQQLFGNGNKSEMDSIFGAIHSHEDDEEEAKILRELNIRGSMDQDLSDLSDTDAEIKNIINEADVMAKQQEKIVGKPEVLESFGKFQRANSVENASSKVQVLKQQAVQLKREGKIQEALALFREAKALEQGDIKTSTSVQSAPSCSSISVPSGIPPYQAQILSQTMNEAVTIAAIAPLVDEQEVEVTEDDMQDPEFLAELAKFGLNDVSSQTDSVESFESQILVTKQKALALKRENKISEALQCMREVKDLETKLRNLKQKQQDTPTKVQALPAKQQLKTVELEISSTTVLSSTSTVAHVNYHEQFNCSIPNALEENNVKVTEKDLNDPVYEEELKKLGLAPSAKYDQASIAAHISASAPANTAKQECQRSFQYRNSSIGEYDLIDEFEENEGDDATTPTFLLPCEKSDPNINLAIVGTTCCAHTESTAIVDEVEESIQVNVTQVSSSLTSTTIAESIVEITQLQSQLQKTKESALKLKREGNMKEALGMMRRVKQIEALIEKKQQKLSMTENNSTNCKFETTSSSNLTVTSVQNSARDQKLDQIEKLLVDFANKTMKDAKEWLPKDRAKAAELVNQRKAYVAQLETLREKRKDPLQQPPAFRIESKTMTEEVQNESIPEDEIHVSIVSIGGMDVSLKGKDVLVKFNLNFPSQAPHEGKTNVIYLSERTSFSSSFSSSMLYRFKVQRSRGTQKLFELKKAVFEVWRPGGLLKNPEMIARGYQALAPLLNVSQINTHVPFVGANRKPIGGDVEIQLRLRTPLREKEFRTIAYETLIIGEYPSVAQIRSESIPNMTQTQESAGPKPLVIAKATPPQIIKTTSNVEPMVLDDPHNLDLIISYDVINEEMEAIQQKLKSLKNTTNPMTLEWNDRYDSLALKKQILEIEMQAEKLTLEIYCGQLKQRILDDKAIITALLAIGKRTDAARVLRRVKIMEKELEGTS